MNGQMGLFDHPSSSMSTRRFQGSIDKFDGAILFSAIGDAFGWPTEFLKKDKASRSPVKLPMRDFISWQKLVGGKWWGYMDTIKAGEYSDDTQLALAVARSISDKGSFDPQRFAYEELPLWLHYERGGGRSIKTAARNLLKPRITWSSNFYKQEGLDYRNAGANGAAMRNLPIALANAGNSEKIIIDSFLNAIITHGHPRAILGTIIFGQAIDHAIREGPSSYQKIVEYLTDNMREIKNIINSNSTSLKWIERWNGVKDNHPFDVVFQEVIEETKRYLHAMRDFKDAEAYYRFVGALEPATKGSGLATVCAALFLYTIFYDRAELAMFTSVNMLGSDTDTISTFVGALFGAAYGIEIVPSYLKDQIQDKEYLLKIGQRLHSIASGEPLSKFTLNQAKPMSRNEAYLRILAWEIGLHEMFWDALGEGATVVHPTIGKGIIVKKQVRKILKQGYVAKLIRVNFECGQTCIFHSRIKDNLQVAESLSEEIEKAMK